jgi:cytochrome c5
MNPVRTFVGHAGPVRRLAAIGLAWAAVLLLPPAHAALWPGDAARAGEHGGREVVEGICARCHASGEKGAPRIGDAAAWGKRSAQGLTSLTRHALVGIRQMPSHGGSPGLTDDEVSRAITYMVNQSGGHWVEPVAAGSLPAERSGEAVVKGQCVKCHQAAVNGAPRIGDSAAWTPRMKRGIDYLVRSAVHGHGGMPPRGGEADLTDAELRGAIVYMIDPKFAMTAPASPPAVVPSPGAGPGVAGGGGSHANHAIVGDLEIFLGVVPAETLRSYPEKSAERTMHGGVPTGPDEYHVNVSIVERKTQNPIDGALVRLRYEPSGLPGLERKTVDLEPIPVGPGSYGRYVHFERKASYNLVIEVRRPGAAAAVEAKFEQSFF